MIKYLLLLLPFVGISSCSAKDVDYYRYHPKELEQVMKQCPDTAPAGVSCQQLEEVAIHVNSLAKQLQYNPQGFGMTILKLQEKIAQQKGDLSKDASNKELQAEFLKNKTDLDEHMAIVRWLESPEG